MALCSVLVLLVLLCFKAVQAAPAFFSESIPSGVEGVQYIALAPRDAVPAQCTAQNMRVRKEWRSLSKPERLSYIKAVQCLHEAPPLTKKYFEPVNSRYDDFVALHMNATNGGIHNVGVFMPWHRLTVWTYESVLRNECNYTGAQPYWDYTLDTPDKGGHFLTSPIWDPVYGFGSSSKNLAAAGAAPAHAPAPAQAAAPAPAPAKGSVKGTPAKGSPKGGMAGMFGGGTCVTDGPFAQYKIYLGPGNSMKSNPRCLMRNLNPSAAESGASLKGYDKLMAIQSYEKFQTLDGSSGGGGGSIFSGVDFAPGFHSVGHMGIGGEMTNPWTSTNDPLFWMHHTELDRLWAIWQGSNATRLADLAAPSSFNLMAMMGRGGSGSKTSEKTMIWMGQFPPSLPIGKIADTQNRDGQGVLCYKYEG